MFFIVFFELKQVVGNNDILINKPILLIVSPQPYDYENFYKLCQKHNGPILTFNPKLEDPMVGIGSTARTRRRDFLNLWETVYWLQPLPKAALIRSFPYDWSLFRSDDDGYRYVKSYSSRPDSDLIAESLQNS